MSARDELVQQADGSFLTREEVHLHLVIKDVYSSVDPRLHVMSPADRAQVVKAVLAAGYRKPRTITTTEELDALPDESVVRSDFGVIHEKRFDFDSEDAFWMSIGSDDEHTAGKITLPAAVLYEPAA